MTLVTRGFCGGRRVHRAAPGFVVQWGGTHAVFGRVTSGPDVLERLQRRDSFEGAREGVIVSASSG